jgi:hypothetical protein
MNFLYLTIYYAIHNTFAQNLSKIDAMINPLVVEVHIVVGSEYSWAIMTNLGHITGSL